MATSLASENRCQGILLGLGGLVVEVKSDLPLPLRHVPGGVYRQGDIEAIQVESPGPPLVDVPPHERRAFPCGRRTQEYAGASDIAVAGLEVGASQIPLVGHGLSS